jgi:hypothetical protein
MQHHHHAVAIIIIVFVVHSRTMQSFHITFITVLNRFCCSNVTFITVLNRFCCSLRGALPWLRWALRAARAPARMHAQHHVRMQQCPLFENPTTKKKAAPAQSGGRWLLAKHGKMCIIVHHTCGLCMILHDFHMQGTPDAHQNTSEVRWTRF